MTKVSRICILIFLSVLLLSGVAEAQPGQTKRWPFRPPAGSYTDSTVGLFDQADMLGATDQADMLGATQIIEGTLSPDTYIVGPGDGFLITIWGKRNEHFQSFITPEGKLLVPQISEIQVAGLTISELKKRLTEEIARFFFDVRVETTLIQLRRFRVYVLGEVVQPGGYPAQAVDRVSQMIDRSGGLLPSASARSIEILRDGAVVEKADLLQFTTNGAITFNPYVRDGDVILVRHYTDEVHITGAVWAPGSYEFRPEDTVGTLVRLASGLKSSAYLTDVELIRFNEDHLTTFSRALDLSDSSHFDWQLPLEVDDQVFVRSIPDWNRRRSVSVTGEVVYPGQYVIRKDSTSLTEVVDMAGGFTVDASLLESYVVRRDSTVTVDPEFQRLQLMDPADMTPTEYEYFKMKSRDRPGVMVVDFQQLFDNQDRTEDIMLKHEDQIFITRNREVIIVAGQVAAPGAITYDPVMGVSDYIEKAGDYGWNARKNKTRVIRAKTGEWLWANRVTSLGPGDTIWVPEKPYRDWWSLFLQGLTTAGQAATVIILLDTIAN
ncbi:MAG: SLBB domain-containing protein [Gemmatimonadota bacterium]|nr:SLBB domain-containing protein [Gemmatimonadota bacterium]